MTNFDFFFSVSNFILFYLKSNANEGKEHIASDVIGVVLTPCARNAYKSKTKHSLCAMCKGTWTVQHRHLEIICIIIIIIQPSTWGGQFDSVATKFRKPMEETGTFADETMETGKGRYILEP